MSSPAGFQIDDPLFQNALKQLQKGNWEAGLGGLNQLIETYPLSQELRALRQEMQLRARMDEYEARERAMLRKQRATTTTRRLLTLAAVFLLAFLVIRTYSNWAQKQVSATRQQLENQVQDIELAVKFRDGQNLLLAGKAGLAMQMFQQVAAANPDYPGLGAYTQQAEKMQAIEALYSEAMRLTNLQDYNAALDAFLKIEAQEPYYKDVSQRISEIKSKFLLTDLLAQADAAYQSGDWRKAASAYETTRSINPQYEPAMIEERLYNAYMNAATSALSEQSDSLDNLKLAEEYFRKALALRPQDEKARQERDQVRNKFKESLAHTYVVAAQEALNSQADSLEALKVAEDYFRKALGLVPNDPQIFAEREMARGYLQAQEYFSKGLWSEVITALEYVYAQNPNYASGTSRQTLYEAYMARGKDLLAAGEYESSLSDFRRAAVLAEEGSTPAVRLFAAQIKVAEAQGALGEYQSAVLVYQAVMNALTGGDTPPMIDGATQVKLDEAERYAGLGYYRTSFRLFRDAVPQVFTYSNRLIYTVQSGEYLTMLANRYNTTVEAILQANNLSSAKQLQAGQELIIPELKP